MVGCMLTPRDVANELNCDPKKLRAFVRDDNSLSRSIAEHGTRYSWTRAEADEIKRKFRARFG